MVVRDEGAESLENFAIIWEEIEPRGGVLGQLDGAVVDPVVQPVRRDAQHPGQLGHGQLPRDRAGV